MTKLLLIAHAEFAGGRFGHGAGPRSFTLSPIILKAHLLAVAATEGASVSQPQIARMVGCTVQTSQRALGAMVARGVLRCIPAKGQRPAAYLVCWDRVAELVPGAVAIALTAPERMPHERSSRG